MKKRTCHALLATGAFLCIHAAVAAPQALHSLLGIEQAAERFAIQRASALAPAGAKVSATATKVDTRIRLLPCPQVTTSQMTTSPPWGRTTVDVSCDHPRWRLYVPVKVAAEVLYPTAAGARSIGHRLTEVDLVLAPGDLATLPRDAVLTVEGAAGRILATTVQPGRALRLTDFRKDLAISAGQKVKIIASGPGFSVASDGTAVSNASEGESVRAVGSNGKPISGTAKGDGTISTSWR